MVLVQRTLFAALMVALNCVGDNITLAQSLNGAADVCGDETKALLQDRDVSIAYAMVESELQLESNFEVVCNSSTIKTVDDFDVPATCELQLVTDAENYVQAYKTACKNKGGGEIHFVSVLCFL